MIESNEFARATGYLVDELKNLARAGADFGVLAAGTPHIIFDEISRQSPIPLLSIVETTCDAAKALRLKRIGLFGTRFTMQGRFFADVFSREEISMVVPDPNEQVYIHDKYFGELVKGIFLPETRGCGGRHTRVSTRRRENNVQRNHNLVRSDSTSR